MDFPSKFHFNSVIFTGSKSVCIYVTCIYSYIIQHNWDGYALVTIAILICNALWKSLSHRIWSYTIWCILTSLHMKIKTSLIWYPGIWCVCAYLWAQMDSSVWYAEIFIILNQWKMSERYRHKSVHLTFWYTTINLKYDKLEIIISIGKCTFCISILIIR